MSLMPAAHSFSVKTRPFWGASLAGIFVILLLLFLLQGLQIGDPDDWDHLLAAQDISWNKLLQNLTSLRTGSALWTGQVDRLNEVYHRRVFLTVALKTVQSLFGTEQTFGYYLCTKLVFFLGSTFLLFLLIFRATRSSLWSFCGTIFYILIPAHYPHLFWLTDPVTMVHFFILCQACLLFSLLKNPEHPKPFLTTLFKCVLFFFLGWLGSKTKEPALIFQFTSILFLLIQAKRLLRMGPWYFLILAAELLVVYTAVPVGHTSFAAQGYEFHPGTIARMLFRNFRCGYIDEPLSAWFSPAWLWPVSISRTFNFLLLWLIAFSTLAVFRKGLTRGWDSAAHFIFLFSSLWLGTEVLSMGFFQPDPRYFSGTMIPIILLAAVILRTLAVCLKGFQRAFFMGLLIFSLLWATGNNLRSIYWLRWQVGKRTDLFWNMAKTVFRDSQPESSARRSTDIARFYSAQYHPDPHGPRLEKLSCSMGLDYGAWDNTSGDLPDARAFRSCAERGFPYYGTFCAETGEPPSSLALLKKIPVYSGPGIFDALVRRWVKPRKDHFCLYRIRNVSP